ncbi:YL1 nuclear protein-domain-containing protein [Cantharellus anzutake]|uniref:YL1 nuclear protein-domain-containing protein n=1 Tax=Cantharellus anzutake TaxID=1750568 RepID=UPI001903D5BA|nr:YL1 nuclear protein-domain-containing protein [Cantharellus anzutake]KAF8330324.1 YL1 nuclear protein-domain-containing protein [Cantharellus anzutake]
MLSNKRDPNSLALGRSKRTGAGNRMRALLDGVFEAEEGFEEVENDEEFEDKGGQYIENIEDDFASDFLSTDDEDSGRDDTASGEKQIQEEVREARRAARRKAERASRLPQTSKPKTTDKAEPGEEGEDPLPKKRRVSVQHVVVNEETGEIVDVAIRKSSREATVRSKHELQNKLKDAQQRRAALPKRERTQQRVKTQDELIRDALETEEENIASLNSFLTEEEERRARNTELRKTIVEPPLLRWISRPEKAKMPLVVEVELPPPAYHRPPQTQLQNPPSSSTSTTASARRTPYPHNHPAYSNSNYRQIPVTHPATYTPPPGWRIMGPPPKPVPHVPPPPPPPPRFAAPIVTTLSSSAVKTNAPAVPSVSPGPATIPSPMNFSAAAPVHSSQASESATSAPSADPKPKPKSTNTQTITQTRNLVILDTPGATPSEDMTYLFGSHVDWGELKVLPKVRPSARRAAICPITGSAARYIDPRSGIPFADARGYKVLTELLAYRYVWSEALGAYVAGEKQSQGAQGVPDGWADAVMSRPAE